MKSITINGSKRESVGKVATKALRNAGKEILLSQFEVQLLP